nr:hypothetical protein KRP22_4537 [Phytophthora ramorum]
MTPSKKIQSLAAGQSDGKRFLRSRRDVDEDIDFDDEERSGKAVITAPLRNKMLLDSARGNPGPGGSGSDLVEKNTRQGDEQVTWAAATALSSLTMTNNVAEFIGLHRLLAHAVGQGWRGLHIVGDSQLILRMIKERMEPKVKRLKHWYFFTRKLADICEIASWRHHFRRHNTMANWLANRPKTQCDGLSNPYGNRSSHLARAGGTQTRRLQAMGTEDTGEQDGSRKLGSLQGSTKTGQDVNA